MPLSERQVISRRAAPFLLATALASGTLPASSAFAQDAASISAIQRQIQELQRQLTQLKQQSAQRDAELRRARAEAAAARQEAAHASQQAAEAAHEPAKPFANGTAGAGEASGGGSSLALRLPSGPQQPPSMASSSPQAITSTAVDRPNAAFQLGGVKVTLGGFFDFTGIYRSRNITSDIASSFNSIPFTQSPQSHLSEYRQTERISRFSLLAQAPLGGSMSATGYFEGDLLGAASTANSNESNSYTPRVRQAFGEFDDRALGLSVLAGQAWSLATQYKNGSGLSPRSENLPLVIDAQYVPGFTWTRNPQLRVTEQIAEHYWLAASVEAPQTTVTSNISSGSALPSGIGSASGQTITYNAPGGSGFASTTNYSADVAPDIIVKAAAEPGFGHYELYGIGRFMRARDSYVGGGTNKTTFAGGVGGNTVLPVIPKYLDIQGSVLAGYGIGRYGSGQLPDATVKSDGSLAPLPEVQALVGVVGHPIEPVDLYAYVGLESIGRKFFTAGGKGYGYGSPLFVNTGCGVELSTATCTGNTQSLAQGTVGGWWRFMHGGYGTLMGGAQYSYTRRQAYSGVGGAPKADENMVFVSLRYLPFQ